MPTSSSPGRLSESTAWPMTCAQNRARAYGSAQSKAKLRILGMRTPGRSRSNQSIIGRAVRATPQASTPRCESHRRRQAMRCPVCVLPGWLVGVVTCRRLRATCGSAMNNLAKLNKVTKILVRQRDPGRDRDGASPAPRGPSVLKADGKTNAAWAGLTERTLDEIKTVDEIYRPTSFWEPARDQLLADLDRRGLENFKSWVTAMTWFFPRYGARFTYATIDATYEPAKEVNPSVNKGWQS